VFRQLLHGILRFFATSLEPDRVVVIEKKYMKDNGFGMGKKLQNRNSSWLTGRKADMYETVAKAR